MSLRPPWATYVKKERKKILASNGARSSTCPTSQRVTEGAWLASLCPRPVYSFKALCQKEALHTVVTCGSSDS